MNYRYIIKELRHHHHRTLVNVLGIAIGIALFVSINAVSTAYQKAVSLPFKNLGADIVVQKPEKRAVDAAQTPTSMRGIRLPFSNQLLSQEELRKLGSLDGVASSASSLLLWEFDQGGFRTIMGVDLSQPSLGPVKVKEWLSSGRFPNQDRRGRPGKALCQVPPHGPRRLHDHRGATLYRRGPPGNQGRRPDRLVQHLPVPSGRAEAPFPWRPTASTSSTSGSRTPPSSAR